MLGACAQCLADHGALHLDKGRFIKLALDLLLSHLRSPACQAAGNFSLNLDLT